MNISYETEQLIFCYCVCVESKFLSCDTMCITVMNVNEDINEQVNSTFSHIRNLLKLIKQLLTYTFNHTLVLGKSLLRV